MIYSIDITGSTGVSPYDIYVCDITNTYCYLVSGSTSIPPTFSFIVPSPLFGVNSLLVKIVDSNGCEDFIYYSCPPTPTPTPSVTPTPTPTPTNLCYCLTASNSGTTDGSFDYIDCDTILQTNILVPSGVTYYTCGSNPTNVSGLTLSVGSLCVDGSCPPPPLYPTPTPSVTSTPTPTPSPVPSFISVWRTTSPGETITLPYLALGTYTGTIDWGDSSTDINSYANRTHTYASPGDYTITITGDVTGFRFNNSGDKLKIIEVLRWGLVKGDSTNHSGMFFGCSNLVLSGVTDTINMTSVNAIQNMFVNCTSLTTINNISSWDVSLVTNMSSMFQNCSSFDGNLGSWDTSNVQFISQMFNGCSSFNNGGSPTIDNWVTSNISNMFALFNSASSFNQPVGSWDVSGVNSFLATFSSASLFDQDISSWDVSNATAMGGMLSFTSMSKTNYDNLLIGWSSQSLQSGVTFGANGRQYTQSPSAAATARGVLTGTYSWTIVGDIAVP